MPDRNEPRRLPATWDVGDCSIPEDLQADVRVPFLCAERERLATLAALRAQAEEDRKRRVWRDAMEKTGSVLAAAVVGLLVAVLGSQVWIAWGTEGLSWAVLSVVFVGALWLALFGGPRK